MRSALLSLLGLLVACSALAQAPAIEIDVTPITGAASTGDCIKKGSDGTAAAGACGGTFSGGSTGLTPSTPTGGNIVLGGTLGVPNGGTGLTAMGAGVTTFLGTPSSANLRTALTDETGGGVAVFNDSPLFTGVSTLAGYTETPCAPAITANVLTIDLSAGCKVFNVASNAIINTVTVVGCVAARANTFIAYFTGNGSTFTQPGFSFSKWSQGQQPTLTGSNGAVDSIMWNAPNGCSTWYGYPSQNFL